MKNKTPLIIGIVVLVLIAAALYFMRGGMTNPLTPTTPEQLVSSALTGSGSVKCEYTDASSGQVVTAYVKGGNVRTDMTGGTEGAMSFIMKDNMTWSWNQGTKEGFTFKIPETQTGEPVETTQTNTDNADKIKQQIEQYKDSCKNQSVPDSVFEVPGDVTFQDYSTMMQGQTQEQIPVDYQQYMPQQ